MDIDPTIYSLFAGVFAIGASLVGALIWTVKRTMTRSEKDSKLRDKLLAQALSELTKAVDAFGRFEKGEVESHRMLMANDARLLDRLDAMVKAQDKLATVQDCILRELQARNGHGQ